MNLKKLKSHGAIFVCGTDTGVGKTIVTASLCAALNANQIRAGAFKPLESGCRIQGSRHLKRADSEFLKKSARMDDSIDAVNPYYFKEPLAPGIAAERESKTISFAKIRLGLQNLQKKYQPVFIEGAGGLLAPVHHLKTNLDLILDLKVPVLLVARLGLGTLNHTLLTLEHLSRNKVKVLGVILNQETPALTVSAKTNPQILKRYRVPLWGVFPHLSSLTTNRMIAAVQSLD